MHGTIVKTYVFPPCNAQQFHLWLDTVSIKLQVNPVYQGRRNRGGGAQTKSVLFTRWGTCAQASIGFGSVLGSPIVDSHKIEY